jgi:hypothetical protein
MDSATGSISRLDGHPFFYQRQASPHVFQAIHGDQTVETDAHPTKDATGFVVLVRVAKAPPPEREKYSCN